MLPTLRMQSRDYVRELDKLRHCCAAQLQKLRSYAEEYAEGIHI